VSEAAPPFDSRASQRRIRFITEPSAGDVVLLSFRHPAPAYAVLAKPTSPADEEIHPGSPGGILDITVLSLPINQESQQSANDRALSLAPVATGVLAAAGVSEEAPIYIKYRGVDLIWQPRHATLQCDPGQAELLVSAIVEFTHYERELRRIEMEVANAWGELEEDKSLAFEATSADLDRSQIVGQRVDRTLQRRIRLARIEPLLFEPEPSLPPAGQKLGQQMREQARLEARLETLDGQLEVFEGIYEMSSQRLGEFRAAHQEHHLEWIIIVLLAAEALLMLAQTLWSFFR
jgi:hypothetical protein